ncbi:MAG: DNA polymerase III [Spirochaetaceae bacterium]|nr:DNA polymerase III [Spirochaetaceae bacterium]
MFDNLLYQPVSSLLETDIIQNQLPQSLLLSGKEASGKLTCALEIARILDCTGDENGVKGNWLCQCNSCLKHKQLGATNLIIAGPRDSILEIGAAKKTLINAVYNQASYLMAARYLFLRSVRKLTLRFSPVLWEEDDKASKVSSLIAAIDEDMEEILPPRDLPEISKLEKLVNSIEENCQKLESSYLYNSIPVSQVRRLSVWARLTSADTSKKTIIIENADKMQESVRNALLKILEEPPADCMFILTTTNRGAVMPTILSRVRTYNFYQRTVPQQLEVIKRVFHDDDTNFNNISEYLNGFLPVSREEIKNNAKLFFDSLYHGKNPDIQQIAKNLNNFQPKLLLRNFLSLVLQEMGLYLKQENLSQTDLAKRTAYAEKLQKAIQSAYNNITIYNINPVSALETVYENL